MMSATTRTPLAARDSTPLLPEMGDMDADGGYSSIQSGCQIPVGCCEAVFDEVLLLVWSPGTPTHPCASYARTKRRSGRKRL